MKKVFFLFLIASVTLFIANVLMVWGNPEVSFWKKYMDRNSERLEKLRDENPEKPVILITGGSSCSFSIDPLALQDSLEMPVCNMGGSASMGASYLIANTLLKAKRGDVVVLALEPGLLSKFMEIEQIPLALEMAIIQGQPTLAVGKPILRRELHLKDVVSTLRPGSRYFSTMISKLIMGRKLYRYSIEDWQDGGRLSTSYKDSLLKPSEKMTESFPISPIAVEVLQDAVKYCEKKGIKLCYTLPWIYTEKEFVDLNRHYNEKFLDEVEQYIPVLRDSYMGVCSNRSLYADTSYHLSNEGAHIRSLELVNSLHVWLSQ